MTIADTISRLSGGYYNSDDKSAANPGGLGDDGHVDNLPALLEDVGAVAAHVGDLATEADRSAADAATAKTDTASLKADVLAANTAHTAAIQAVAATAAGDRDAAAITVPPASNLAAGYAVVIAHDGGAGAVTLTGGLTASLPTGSSLGLIGDGAVWRTVFASLPALASARWWRVRSVGSTQSGSNYVDLCELELYASADGTGTDLTTGKSAAASTNYNSSYPAGLAIDNNSSSFWASAAGDPGPWLSADLEAAAAVRSFRLTFYLSAGLVVWGTSVLLEWSNDGSAWTTAGSYAVASSAASQLFVYQ